MIPSQSLYTDESESEPDATPKGKRTATKKRVSENFRANEEEPPAKAPKPNDDKAEKRRRRKSNKIHVVENAEAGPSSADQAPPAAGVPRGLQRQLHAVAQEAPVHIVAGNFEEWMKMATDNKINAANSWNFALIDYFEEMSLLRNEDDKTINFQRASCTLDGCVKIWTSRVDSVGTETSKLLSNLAADARSDNEEDDDEGGNGSDNPDGPTQEKRKKKQSSGDTLAKPGSLHVKKFELEFAIDPLFKKTHADFDEGGASGLLMNHLSLGMGGEGSMRVVFDASDSGGQAVVGNSPDEPEDDVDIAHLLKTCFPDLGALEGRSIAPSLEEFSFSKDPTVLDESTFFQDSSTNDDDEGNEPQFEGGPMGDMDFNQYEEPGLQDDYNNDQENGEYMSVGVEAGFEAGGEGERQGGGPLQPFDPQKQHHQRDLVMAIGQEDGSNGGVDMLNKFDNEFTNYGGPGHFKLKKAIRRAPDDEKKAPAKKTREKKEAVKIDFSALSNKSIKEIATELFAGPAKGKGSTINLTGTSGRKKKGTPDKKPDHLLPDDLHFTSKNLVTLFLKPKFQLQMRGQRARIDEATGEVLPDFWAAAAAAGDNQNDDANNQDTGFNDDDDNAGFFDDDDMPFGAGGGDMPGPIEEEEQDLLAATEGITRKIKPESVKYAKRAKRVDVKRLKDNIWRSLDITAKKEEEEDTMDLDDIEPEEDPKVFRQVISGLQGSYSKEKMGDISTSFCFICLLHLANEQGLKLEGGVRIQDPMDEAMDVEDEDEEVRADERRVGNIWDVKVSRDPNATSDS